MTQLTYEPANLQEEILNIARVCHPGSVLARSLGERCKQPHTAESLAEAISQLIDLQELVDETPPGGRQMLKINPRLMPPSLTTQPRLRQAPVPQDRKAPEGVAKQQLLELLKGYTEPVKKQVLADAAKLSGSAVWYHLNRLRAEGLVVSFGGGTNATWQCAEKGRTQQLDAYPPPQPKALSHAELREHVVKRLTDSTRPLRNRELRMREGAAGDTEIAVAIKALLAAGVIEPGGEGRTDGYQLKKAETAKPDLKSASKLLVKMETSYGVATAAAAGSGCSLRQSNFSPKAEAQITVNVRGEDLGSASQIREQIEAHVGEIRAAVYEGADRVAPPFQPGGMPLPIAACSVPSSEVVSLGDDALYALFSDGHLEIHDAGQKVVFNPKQTRELISYLDRLCASTSFPAHHPI